MFCRNERDINNKACYNDLYDSAQRILYRVGGRDEKLLLNIKVSMVLRYGYSEEKCMKLIITDNDNPLLLYSTEIDAEIYAKLKQKLGLLIDFSQFPHQLVSLLNQCSSDNGGSASKYALVLEEMVSDPYDIVEGQCILFKIVEVNEFQRLCLVALHVICGTESEVNSFMARNMTLLKQRIEQLNTQLKEAQCQRAAAEENLSVKNFEIERLKLQFGNQLKSQKCKAEEETASARRETDRLHAEYERRLQEALHDASEKHHRATAQQEMMGEKLRAEVKALKVTNGKLELELAEKQESLCKMVDDIKLLQDELLKSENKISRLETDATERNMFVVSLKQRVSQLERKREEEGRALKKMSTLLESADAGKTHLKTLLKEKCDSADALNANLSAATKDLAKANEIIGRLSKDNKQLSAKLGRRTEIAVQQEKVIEECRENLARSQQTATEESAQLRQLQAQMETLRGRLSGCEDELKQKEQIIRKNERIIGWLNDIVGKQGTRPSSAYAASSTSNGQSTCQLSVPDGSVDKKLLQLTINSNDRAKSNGAAAAKKTNRNQPMRSK